MARKTGGIVTQEAPIHVSNVMLVVEVDGQKVGTRVGFRRRDRRAATADGRQTSAASAYAKRTGEDI